MSDAQDRLTGAAEIARYAQLRSPRQAYSAHAAKTLPIWKRGNLLESSKAALDAHKRQQEEQALAQCGCE
jgi:hypothetical protein